ncbi:MAG: thiol reductant ABC exporter subunit CydC [Clostridia bacterium]|nr:thiol reductant ABC exporter subunit CydC [Clostridia bacterium]
MKKRSKAGTLFKMLGLVRPLTGFMALAVTAGTLGYLAVQFIPVLGGYAILHGLGYAAPMSIHAIWTCLILFALLRAVLRYTEQRTNHYIAFTLLAIVRDRVFQALRRLCPAKLEGRDKGDLISLITSDVELLEVFYAHTISPICIAVLTEACMCLFIGSFHPQLGLLALIAFLCVGVAVPLIISRVSGDTGDRVRGQSGALASYVLENIRGVDETIQYGNGAQRLAGMNERTDALSRQQDKMNRLTGLNLAIANTAILIFDVLMVFAAARLYRAGAVGFDGFLIPVLALMSSFGPVSALSGLGTTLQNTIASGGRVLDILEESPETDEIAGQPEIDFHGAACRDVTFAYAGETVLRDFSMVFPENRVVGVTGKSGSGKSTLLKLLMRFWKTGKGSISLSGTDIERVNTDNLRRMESYMTQETQLFKDTIAANIRIGRLDATQQEIEDACKKAAIHDFILSLPQGYETSVGELGQTLSGGERQRIGLARAFLHNAPFMLLDEPTSNLDSLNEAIILKSLRQEAAGRTVVLVSHRASTMRIADEIHSVENGRVC